MSPEKTNAKDFLSDAKQKRENQGTEVEMAYTEYNKIIMLCHSFFQAFIESYQGQPMMTKRRNRLFQTIEIIARHRKGLPSVSEHFGDRPVGIFSGMIAEIEALEYVNIIQTKVMEMNDPKVSIDTLDDDIDIEENEVE